MDVARYVGLDGLAAAVGEEVGPGDWLVLEQERVDGFADDTEDHQWIHVDPQRAAAGPFGGTVAHGFLTLSLVPHLVSRLRQVEGVRMGINYGLNRVRFPTPVRVGSRIRARFTMTEFDRLDEESAQIVTRVTVEIDGEPKPACVAELVSRYYM